MAPSRVHAALLLALGVPAGIRQEGLDTDCPEVVTTEPTDELLTLHHSLFERVVDGQIGCLSVLVAVDGEVLWQQGFGWADPAARSPASVSTIYPVASISKGLVGLAASLLIAEGKLALETPVSDALTSFDVATGSWIETPLRIRDLAQMTAGMPHGGMSWVRGAPATAREGSSPVVRSFAVVDEEPGREYRYSNYTSGVLEAVVQDVSGEALSDFLQRRVFGPLEMHSTAALCDPENPALVRVHSGQHVFDVAPFLTPSGGQGFYSSVADLARLAALFLDPERGVELGLSPVSLSMARSPPDGKTVGPGEYWMGWGHLSAGELRFEMSNGQGFDATSCMILCPARKAMAICLTDTQWEGRPGEERLADVVAMQLMDRAIGGCTETYERAKARFVEAEAASARQRPARMNPSPVGSWSGTLTLAGEAMAAELEVRDGNAATFTFGRISASSPGLVYVDGRLQGSFRCTGELTFFGETSELSEVSLRLAPLDADRLGGSALLSSFAAARKTIGSGAALLELTRRRAK